MSIEHVPPEVLITIFLHLAPLFDASNPERVPKVLSQVCTLWRIFTLALPALWATLNITCNHRILHPQLHTIHTHLRRSAAHPLSIVLKTDSPDDMDVPLNAQFSALLAALVVARNRWRHVSITLASEAAQETLDAITQGDAPLLQSFSCNIKGTRFWEVPLIPLHALQGYPRLESLTWHCILAPSSSAPEGDSWPQLTTLDLVVALTASDCFTLLQLSPQLSIAKLSYIDIPGDAAPHHLLHTSLRILDARGTYGTTLISMLTLPALVDLNIYVRTAVRQATVVPNLFSDFLSRSTPPLRILSLINVGIPEPALLNALALIEGLRSLFLAESGPGSVPLTSGLIYALDPSLPSGPRLLCPRLSSLTLNKIDAPDGACAQMLWARSGRTARRYGVVRLSMVFITLEGEDHGCDHANVEPLDKEGMFVTFSRGARS